MKKMRIVAFMALVFTQTLMATDIAMLVDTSGSMSGKESSLERLVDTIWQKSYDIEAYSFADGVSEIKRHKPYNIRIGGYTNLSGAIAEVVGQTSLKVLVIMTDGMPNNPQMVQNVVRHLKHKPKICSVYVGTGAVPEVLHEISDVVLEEKHIEKSLDRCLMQSPIINALPMAPEVEMDNPYEM
jgi:uncharacterized protein with von Willebrand factor type A (vWA) domain